MKEFAGRLTLVMTPELRQLAVDHILAGGAVSGDDEGIVQEWFQEQETPDGHVIDAAYSEAEALMILVIASAIHERQSQAFHEGTNQEGGND